MARARNIKPGFYKNEDLAECSIWARFIFPGLWMLADREGRLEDRPKRIKGELLPFDSQDVDPLLVELEERGFLERYRNSDGSFIQISKFSIHQYPHYSEKPSAIKPPTFQESTPDKETINPGALPDNSEKLSEYSEKPSAIKRGSQPPCLLNPESLCTDSLNPLKESAAALASTPQKNTPPPAQISREVQISVLLRGLEKARGKVSKATSNDPRLLAWATRGVTDAHIREAHSIAVADREAAGDDGAIGPGFLDVFIGKLLNPGNGKSIVQVVQTKAPDICVCCGDRASKKIGQQWFCQDHDHHSPMPDHLQSLAGFGKAIA